MKTTFIAKRIFLFLSWMLFCQLHNSLFGQSKEWVVYLNLKTEAEKLYKEGKTGECKFLFKKMLSQKGTFCFGVDLYSYVYCLASTNDTTEIKPFLFELVNSNWFEYHFIEDTVFTSLHVQPYWKVIDSIAQKNGYKNYVMIDSLAKMKKLDQQVRRNRNDIYKDSLLTSEERDSLLSPSYCAYVDSLNVQKLKRLIDLYGFPTWKLVGSQGAYDAWLIAQHAPPSFQESYLDQYEKEMKEKNVYVVCYAYLVDRVRSRKRIPQLYGTQMYGGSNAYHPIEDKEHLNDRRESVLLPPLDLSTIQVLEEYKH